MSWEAPSRIEEVRRRALLVPAILLFLVVAIAIMTFALVRVVGSSRQGPKVAEKVAAPQQRVVGGSNRQAAAPVDSEPQAEAPKAMTPAELVAELRELPRKWRENRAEGEKKWAELLARLGEGWCEMEPGDFAASLGAGAEFVRVATLELPEPSAALVEEIGRNVGAAGTRIGKTEVRRVIWSCGFAGRLLSRDDVRGEALKRALVERVEQAAGTAPEIEDPFVGYAVAAMGELGERLIARGAMTGTREGRAEAWGAISEAAGALKRLRSNFAPVVDSRLLDVAETVLKSGADPSTEAESRAALARVLGACRWARGDPGRERFLAWLDDESISAGALVEAADVVRTKLNEGSAGTPGEFLASSKLSASSGIVERRVLRRELAREWGMTVSHDADVLAARWSDAAWRRLTAPPPMTDEPERVLGEAVSLSMLSAAAAAVWKGDEDGARERIVAAQEPRKNTAAAELASAEVDAVLASLTAAGSAHDGRWAAKYLGANGNEARLAEVNELVRAQRKLGPVDSDVLTGAAVLGPSAEIRAAARRAISLMPVSVVLLHSMLEASVQMPRDVDLSELVQTMTGAALPKVDDPRWSDEAQVALVGAIASMVGGAKHGEIDELSELLADSIDAQAGWIGEEKGTKPAGRGPESPPPESDEMRLSAGAAARDLADGWAKRADAIVSASRSWKGRTPEMIERSREVRLGLAHGAVQRFCAEEACAAELMAVVVAGERQSRAAAVEQIMEELGAACRGAKDVFQQIAAIERAVLKLWTVRLGYEREEGAG